MSSTASEHLASRRSRPRGSARDWGWIAVVIVLVTVLASTLGWLIYARVISANQPLSWDEAAHSLFGVSIAEVVRRGDLFALAHDTYRQVYWPPLHSWLLGAGFLLFGERIAVARSVSLLAYVLIPVSMVAAARVMQPRGEPLRGWVASAIAGLIMVAMPALVPFASLAFLDLPALLAVCLTLVAAFWAEREPDRPQRRALVATGILGAFFLKTNYGVLLLLAFAIDAAVAARWAPKRLLVRRNAYWVVPIVIVLALWFAYPPKVAVAIRAMVNTPTSAARSTLAGLLFYPRTLLTFAGSWPMLFVLVAGFAVSWRERRSPNVRLLLILAVAQFMLGEMHHTKEDRHILPLVPPLVLLAAAAGGRIVADATGRERRRRLTVGFAVAFAALIAAHVGVLVRNPFPTAWPVMPGVPGPAYFALVDAMQRAVARGDRVLLVGTYDLDPGPPLIDWDLVVNRRLLPIEVAGGMAVVDEDRRAALAIRRAPLPRSLARPVLRALERSDAPSRLRTLYAGLPVPVAPNVFAGSVAETLSRGRIDVVVAAASLATGTRFPPSYLAPALAIPGLVQLSTRVVDAGSRIWIAEYRVDRTMLPTRRVAAADGSVAR